MRRREGWGEDAARASAAWMLGAVGALGIAGCSAQVAPAKGVKASAVAEATAGGRCELGAGRAGFVPLSRSSSTVALARNGTTTLAFVSDEDARRVSVLDVDGGKELAAATLASAPGALLVSPSGDVVVTLPLLSRVELLAFDGRRLESRCSVATAAEPVGLALVPDGRTLLVTSAWGHSLGIFATAPLAEQARVELPRDPRAVVVTEDGARAFVSHGVGGVLSSVELAPRRVERVSLDAPPSPEARERLRAFREGMAQMLAAVPADRRADVEQNFAGQEKELRTPERFANQGYALALQRVGGGRVLVPQVEVDPGSRASRSPGYGTPDQTSAEPSVAVVDATSSRLDLHSIPPSPPRWGEPATNEACRLPRAAAMDEANGTLLVTCLGTDLLVGYDTAAPSPVAAERLHVRLAAGPTGVAVDAASRRAVVWSQFERVLSVVPLPDAATALPAVDPSVRRIALSTTAEGASPAFALGRRLFHATDDLRIARDGRACASCHLGGRDDGLVWSTPRGPRRTKALAGLVAGTAPYSWDGSSGTLHEQIEGTLERLDGKGGLRSVEVDALALYVASLPAPPRDTEHDATVERGAKLFASTEVGCATCHGGSAHSDAARHRIESETPADATSRFDTPSLAFVSGRAPYFHDGRYATLGELLAASGDKMGHTSHLSQADRSALEAFLETL